MPKIMGALVLTLCLSSQADFCGVGKLSAQIRKLAAHAVGLGPANSALRIIRKQLGSQDVRPDFLTEVFSKNVTEETFVKVSVALLQKGDIKPSELDPLVDFSQEFPLTLTQVVSIYRAAKENKTHPFSEESFPQLWGAARWEVDGKGMKISPAAQRVIKRHTFPNSQNVLEAIWQNGNRNPKLTIDELIVIIGSHPFFTKKKPSYLVSALFNLYLTQPQRVRLNQMFKYQYNGRVLKFHLGLSPEGRITFQSVAFQIFELAETTPLKEALKTVLSRHTHKPNLVLGAAAIVMNQSNPNAIKLLSVVSGVFQDIRVAPDQFSTLYNGMYRGHLYTPGQVNAAIREHTWGKQKWTLEVRRLRMSEPIEVEVSGFRNFRKRILPSR